ncbi:protein of unknown function DUF4308 [Cynara cardunculus var. scolymus]|uniref:Cyanobacterial aminoacyl-tRNA synthetase CAAD domain-containing protein n=1 Tax=Cynara cardunculus var. scolymus TaxID=59895 RepID=A0A103XV01_CYNCS|nr:protein of unknown function DUF4308 [Cynara cardunculus var. scolymus]
MSLMTTAAISTSMASTAVTLPRLPALRCTAVPNLPCRPFPTSIKLVSEDASSPPDANELFADLKEKWDAVENKPTVIIYGGGGVVAIWLSSVIIGAINKVPLVPNIMELVGVGYTGWFVYRYLLFKSSRKELATTIESIKKEITEP